MMTRLKELQEAKEAAEVVIDRVDDAIISMKKVSFYGAFDMFGGGFFTSMLKRSNIEDANN